jgi:hypothetical protein
VPTFTTWYVTVILQVAGKQQTITGPSRDSEDEVKADLKQLQDLLGGGDWINLDWISANPANVVAAHVDSSSIGLPNADSYLDSPAAWPR